MTDQNRNTVSSALPGHLVRRLHQLSTQVFMRRMQEAGYDLTAVQFATLDALAANPGIDQARLAGLIAKDRATTGQVIDRLLKKGLLERRVSATDRRARQLVLSREGRTMIMALIPIVTDLQKEILPGLSDAEYRRFIALADKVVRAASLSDIDPSNAD